MEHRTGATGRDRRALPVVVLGVLVAVVPVVLLLSPGDGGPVTVAVRLLQAVGALAGHLVAAAGAYSYWTGDLRPAAAAGTATVGLVAVGAVGALIETAGGPLVPIPAWLVAAAAVVVASLRLASRVGGVEG
ncbi:MAG: hypothetical protein ABEI39_06460 [Halobacteriales archaeon]